MTADNRTWFSGGSGVLSAGGILASILSVWMIPIIIFSLLGSWFYSSPPFSLMSSGWGELTTSLTVALMVPLAGYCMQGGFPPAILWLVCFPLVLIHAAMLISFELPDHTSDLTVGKKTLAVRIGLRGAAWVVDALITGAFLFLGVLTFYFIYPVWRIGWALPLAIWQMTMVHFLV